MTIESIGEIYLEGFGGGTTIEVKVEWNFEPGYPASWDDPGDEDGATDVKVTGWRWPVPDKWKHLPRVPEWLIPDEMTELMLYECIDHQWLLTLGNHEEEPVERKREYA